MKLEQCHVGKMVRSDFWCKEIESERLIWCDEKSAITENSNGQRRFYHNASSSWLLDEPKKKYGLYAFKSSGSHIWYLASALNTEEGFNNLVKDTDTKYHFPVKFDADGFCELPE